MIELSNFAICIIGIIFVILAFIVVGIDETHNWILDNEILLFIGILILVCIIGIIYYKAFAVDCKDNNEIKTLRATALSSIICVSSNIFFVINTLFDYLLENDNGFGAIILQVLLSPVWMIVILIYLLLSFGVPALIIAICYFIGIGTAKNALRISLEIVSVASSAACFVIIVLPAFMGNFSIYSI